MIWGLAETEDVANADDGEATTGKTPAAPKATKDRIILRKDIEVKS